MRYELQLTKSDNTMIEYTVKIFGYDEEQTAGIYWYHNRHLSWKLHRVDGPAVELVDGTKKWYFDDQLHRTDGPAIEFADGRKEWHHYGHYYKTEWTLNGQLHRIGGPAVEYSDGSKEWYQYGLRHREDGPAREYTTQEQKQWCLYNKEYSEADWKLEVAKIRKNCVEVARISKEFNNEDIFIEGKKYIYVNF